MAGHSNVPNDLQESIRNVLDRHIKLSIRRLVKQEVRPDKWESKVLAFSSSRLFVFTGKAPTKVENSIHYLDIQSIESKKPCQLVLTVDGKPLSFYTMEAETEEVDHMISHIGTSLKTTFPAFPLEYVPLDVLQNIFCHSLARCLLLLEHKRRVCAERYQVFLENRNKCISEHALYCYYCYKASI